MKTFNEFMQQLDEVFAPRPIVSKIGKIIQKYSLNGPSSSRGATVWVVSVDDIPGVLKALTDAFGSFGEEGALYVHQENGLRISIGKPYPEQYRHLEMYSTVLVTVRMV